MAAWKIGSLVLALVAGLGLLSAVGRAQAQTAPPCTIHWTGAGDAMFWDTAANWNLHRVPNSTDNVCLSRAAESFGSVALGRGYHIVADVTTSGQLASEDGGVLTVTHSLTLAAGGKFWT